MGSAATLARDFALFLLIHRRESTSAAATATAVAAGFASTAACFATATTSLDCLFRIELVRTPSLVRGTTTLAGDLALFLFIHRGESTTCSLAVTVRCFGMPVRHLAVPFALIPFASFVMVRSSPMMVSRCFMVKRCVAVMGRHPTLAADLGHMFAIPTDGFTAAATGFGCLFRIELVSGAVFVRSATTLAGDFALFFFIHCREPSPAILPSHVNDSFVWRVRNTPPHHSVNTALRSRVMKRAYRKSARYVPAE